MRSSTAPGDRFDAIVIGAGLSGLTAAAYLAQAGARVLVGEQAGQVGGLFNSFWRAGYLLDGGSEGATMGWSYHRGCGLPRGKFLQMRGAVLTPVPRLLTAGHWTFSPGGSPTAISTGKVAAEHVLKNIQADKG